MVRYWRQLDYWLDYDFAIYLKKWIKKNEKTGIRKEMEHNKMHEEYGELILLTKT